MFERVSEAAVLRFTVAGPALYEIDLEAVPGASGSAIKAAINDAFAWMFINTDALVLRGQIAAENEPCLALVPHVPGYRLDRGTDTHCFTLTLARWAKTYGIQTAVSEMRSAGNDIKATKLESAAKAAGAI